jgi:hypothetical protein
LAITVHLQEFSGCVDWYYYIIPGCLIETIVHKNPSPISSLSPANGRFVTLNDVAIASYVRKFAAVWEGFDMKAPPLPDNLKFFPAFNPDSGDRIDSEIPQFWKDFARKWWKNGF